MTEEWVERDEKFFCKKCYGKNYSDVSFDDKLEEMVKSGSVGGTTAGTGSGSTSGSGAGSSVGGNVLVVGGATTVDKKGDKHIWENTTFKALSWCGFCMYRCSLHPSLLRLSLFPFSRFFSILLTVSRWRSHGLRCTRIFLFWYFTFLFFLFFFFCFYFFCFFCFFFCFFCCFFCFFASSLIFVLIPV
jgi:hypothetical protein